MRKRLAQLAVGSMIAVTPFTVSFAPTVVPGLMGTASADICVGTTCVQTVQPVCNGGGNCCEVSNHINSGCITPPPCDPNCGTPTSTSGTVATEP